MSSRPLTEFPCGHSHNIEIIHYGQHRVMTPSSFGIEKNIRVRQAVSNL